MHTQYKSVHIFYVFFDFLCLLCYLCSVNKKILALALPSIASNITVPLLGLCDVTIMGHIGGATSIAAIAIGSMIFNVMYWLFGFLRMGTSGLTAQAYGRETSVGEGEPGAGLTALTPNQDPRPAVYPLSQDNSQSALPSSLRILKSSLLAGLLLGLAIVVLQVPLQWLSFWLMQMQDDVAGLCTHYYYTCVWGAPAMLGLYSLMGWFIGMQDTRTPMVIAIGQNVLNIALSLTLVIMLKMGIVGVALGTMVSQWAAFLAALAFARHRVGTHFRLCLPIFSRRATSIPEKSSGETQNNIRADSQSERFGLTVRTVQTPSPNRSDRKRQLSFVKVYSDIFLRTLCLVAVNLYFTSAGSAQGALTLAANTLLMQFFMFFSYVMDGFAFAGEALAGKSYGAGDKVGLRRVVELLFRWGLGVAVVFTIAYWLLGGEVLSLLTSDREVIAAAEGYMVWAVLIPVAGMAAFVWDGIFIGITATRGMLWSCLVASVAFFAVYLLLAPIMANHALWLAMLVYLALRGLLQTLIFIH